MVPSVEIIIAIAINAGPKRGKIAASVEVPTRSAGACWMALSGRVMRYARFAKRYKAITVTVPITIGRVPFPSGLRSSPAANAVLSHEAAEKGDPVALTHGAT